MRYPSDALYAGLRAHGTTERVAREQVARIVAEREALLDVRAEAAALLAECEPLYTEVAGMLRRALERFDQV